MYNNANFFSPVQPLWWNPSSNGGFGEWTPDFCKLINSKSNLVWFSCSRLGYYGYRFSRTAFGSKTSSGSGFRLHHPVAYVCAAICISVLLLSTMVIFATTVNVRKPNVRFDKPNKKVFRFQTFGWLPLNRMFGSTKLDIYKFYILNGLA